MTHTLYQTRLTAVRQNLANWEINAIFITDPTNRRWLSGFTGSAGVLFISPDHALIGTDFRYWEQAQQQAPDFALFKTGRTADMPKDHDLIKKIGQGIVGIEGDSMSVNQFSQLHEKLAEADIHLEALKNPVNNLRHVKTAREIDQIRQAAAITDWAMAQVNELFRPGMSEKEAAWELEKLMREHGADSLAFDIIVASGPNAALAHHRPGNRPLQTGDTIVIDMGAKFNGYHSDMTRTFHLGSNPSEKFWEIYNLVHTAQQNALNHIKAGLTGAEIDALARDVIIQAGYGEQFGHGLGHGVGLDIHEGPRLGSTHKDPIPAGAIVSVEPGVYLPNWGGVRIEDLVLITETGFEFISHCPKNPIIDTE